VGDGRIIADIEDGVVLITVVRIGNRREVAGGSHRCPALRLRCKNLVMIWVGTMGC